LGLLRLWQREEEEEERERSVRLRTVFLPREA
jgi:hypothetical protein